MPDTSLSLAMKEAYASAPTNELAVATLEFIHPSFVDEKGAQTAIRVVCDHVNLIAKLELGAPLNAGQQVTFIAFNFDFQLPNVEAVATPEFTITLDNVTREIEENLALASSSPHAIKAIYRIYLLSDLTQPQNNPPWTFDVKACEADDFQVHCRASFGDASNVPFPGLDYTPDQFPGLVR